MVRRFGDASVLSQRFVEEREPPCVCGLAGHSLGRIVVLPLPRGFRRILTSFVLFGGPIASKSSNSVGASEQGCTLARIDL